MEGYEQMVKMYLEGVSVIDIAKHFGCSRETVYARLRKMPQYKKTYLTVREAKKASTIGRHKDSVPEVYRLLEQGMSATGISKELNIPYPSLRTLLRGTKYDNSQKSKRFRNQVIYTQYKRGATQNELAKKYGIAQSTISLIISNWEKNKSKS